jgi:HEAT repeat protein
MRRIILFCSLLLVGLPTVLSAAQPKRSITDLIADLKKADEVKLKAIAELEALGDKAGEAVPALIDLLLTKNEDVRLHVVMAMAKIGQPAVGPLSKALASYYPDPDKIDTKKIDALVKKLGSGNFAERDQARKELETIGMPALEPLRKAAKNSDLEASRRATELVKTIEAQADIRFYLTWGLAFVGPQAKDATPVVIKALSDPTAQVRRKAAYTLGRIDPDPITVAPALVAALADADNDVREACAGALPKMSKAAVPELIKALKGDQKGLWILSMKILGEIGAESAKAIPDLRDRLLQPDQASASAAADALAGIGAPALKVLTEAAANKSDQVRALAVRSLHKIGAPAIPTLVDLLGAKDVDVQRQVAALLGGMQVNDKSVVIGLGYATKDKDYQVRLSALQSLQRMGSAAKLAEPYIVVLLTDLDPQIRLTAFHTLKGMDVDPAPGLKKALGHPDLKTRITTASLMTQLNFEVGLAEPILVDGLKAKDESLKMQAADALSLRGLRENEVLPIFIAGLKNDLASVRRQAAESIARYGTKASKAGPALIAALEDTDDSVVGQSITALRVIGADPKLLFPAMVKVLRRKDASLHPAASQIIFQVGPEAIDDIVALLKKEEAPGIRLACLQTLAMVGPRAKSAVGELTKALEDPAPRARMNAARALGNIGPDAKAAEDALTKALKDTDGNVKAIAEAALTQIKADPNGKEFEVKGVLTAGDPFDKRRTAHFHVVHTYYMKKAQQYQIDLISQWDNYLRLENAQGVQLAEDDDGGGFPNARIIIRAPQDGWYRIIVTTYGAGAQGPYTLKVK